jgi:hypothetical protein
MDDQEFATSVLYRLAYGLAADRVEASRFDTLGYCPDCCDFTR